MEPRHCVTPSSGKRIHSIACGTAKPTFHFLHANGLCAGTYLPLFENFRDDFSILATDLPGHGDSAHHGFRKITHWDIFVDPVKEAIVRHMNPPVVGAGHSLGAVVTLLTAARYPGLFSRIVLIDPVIFSSHFLWLFSFGQKTGLIKDHPLSRGARRRKTVFRNREEALERFSTGRGMFRTWNREFIEAYCAHGLAWNGRGEGRLKCSPETEAQIYESILLDIWDYPGRVTCPTLLVRGEKSDTFKAAAAQTLQRRIRGSRLVTVSGAGHFIPMEKPGPCRDLIVNFVKEEI